jgi:hypothetical protein
MSLKNTLATQKAAKRAERARRAAARAATTPARRHLPPMPAQIPIGFTAAQRASLLRRDRRAIDAVLSGTGTGKDLAEVEIITIVQRRMLQQAAAAPDRHQVDPDAIGALLAMVLIEVVPAVAGVLRRHRETGRVGCGGIERRALLDLADVTEQTLAAIPRRLHSEAYLWGADHPTLEVQP